ncbi:MAG: 4'-phosphopantetheinyl transferase superfamily protein [Planctomycetes bacterium]|nr:4'-phosphopantetheinyl transferase superfamily protein [Planctomycetota bacterium]
MATDEVHVWHLLAEQVAAPNLLEVARGLLADDERQRMNCFRQERDRLLFLLSRVLMRTVLASYLGCDAREVRFGADDHGKPILHAGAPGVPPVARTSGSPLQFNLTHSRGAVALAVSGGCDVGVDIEERQRSVEYLALAERFFAPAEAAHLRALPVEHLPAAFFAVWTLKEAYVKGIGRGLSFPLDAFCFDLDVTRLLRFRPLADFVSPDWHFQQFELGERHCGAVAVQNPGGGAINITLRDWREAFV